MRSNFRIEIFRKFVPTLPPNPHGSCCLKLVAAEDPESKQMVSQLERMCSKYNLKYSNANVLQDPYPPLWKLLIHGGLVPWIKKIIFGIRSYPCIVIRNRSLIRILIGKLTGSSPGYQLIYPDGIQELESILIRVLSQVGS